MAEYLIQSETLDDIADAINAKTGGSSAMTPAEMVDAIGSISGGGGITPEYHEYVQAEAWTSDATGNAVTFCETYLNNGNGLYRAFVENNNGTYHAKRATLFRFSGSFYYIGNTNGTLYGSFTRNTNTTSSLIPSTSISFYLKAGAIVKVYYYPTFGEGDFDFPS